MINKKVIVNRDGGIKMKGVLLEFVNDGPLIYGVVVYDEDGSFHSHALHQIKLNLKLAREC